MNDAGDIRVDTAGVGVVLSAVGPSNGPPVVLVPGLAAGPMPFVVHPQESMATALAAAGLQPWTIDFQVSWRHRGPDVCSLHAALEASLDAVCRHCETERSQVLAVGHSLGGTLLLAVQAGPRPLGGVAALASAACFAHPDAGPWAARLADSVPLLSAIQPWVVGGVPTRALARMASRWAQPLAGSSAVGLQFCAGATAPAHIEAVLRQGVRDLPWSLLLDLASLYAPPGLRLPGGEPLASALSRIEEPLLLVAARQDQQCPLPAVRAAHRSAARAELLEVGDADSGTGDTGYGHLDLLSGARAPADVFAPVARFLRESRCAEHWARRA